MMKLPGAEAGTTEEGALRTGQQGRLRSEAPGSFDERHMEASSEES